MIDNANDMTQLQIPMTQAAHLPLSERFNFRLWIFVAVFAVLLGYPLYLYLDSTLTGGIKNRGGYFDVDLKQMSSFAFDQENGRTTDVPPRWRELQGKRVMLRGEIAPSGLSARGVDHFFEMVYSVQKCCFSGPPQIQHFIQVTAPPTANINVTSEGEVAVIGTLNVEVTRDPETGKINGVYHVRAEDVRSVR